MQSDQLYRFCFFMGIFVVVMIWEFIYPKRALAVGRSRYVGNLGIAIINTVIGRFAVPLLPISVATVAAERGWGVLSLVSLPGWVTIPIGVILLDLIIYLQHVMFHGLPSLWKIHMMHHADHDIDLTTGLRFHPLEILISLIIKLGAVILLGVPAVGVLAFEIILNGMAMFNHGNIRIISGLDRILRIIIVTPDMHRVHHSVIIAETNSNFGFNLSVWDYLFGTYKARPLLGHDNMTIGVSHLRELKWQNLLWMLALPFITGTGTYPLSRYGQNRNG